MLQQTQVSRVLVKYPEFLKTFPTLTALANAKRSEVVRAWKGMGYNNRAVRLHLLARIVANRHSGGLPRDEEGLLALPGIGLYTARAMLTFAFGNSAPAIDVNGRRVLSRVFWKMRREKAVHKQADVLLLAEALIEPGGAYDWNQAIMDFGATMCTARAPQCETCDMNRFCASFGRMRPDVASILRREPSLRGIPNRIYRGRVVERLRDTKRAMPFPMLGRSIHAGFSKRHHAWLGHILSGLEKDGLVKLYGNGSFRSRRIALA